MASIRPNAGAEITRLLEQQLDDRVERAKLQARIHQASSNVRVREAVLGPLVPAISPLLDIRV